MWVLSVFVLLIPCSFVGLWLEGLVNGGNVGSVMDVIGLFWCGIVGGLHFSLELNGGARGVANFGAGLRFAYSSSGKVL